MTWSATAAQHLADASFESEGSLRGDESLPEPVVGRSDPMRSTTGLLGAASQSVFLVPEPDRLIKSAADRFAFV